MSGETDVARQARVRHTKVMKIFAMVLLAAGAGLIGCQRSRLTYDAGCPEPLAGFTTAKDGHPHLLPVLAVTIDSDGKIMWAGRSVSAEQVRSYMNEASNLDPAPQVILDPSPSAPCSVVKQVRDAMAKTCQGGRLPCSEGRDWKKWREVGGP